MSERTDTAAALLAALGLTGGQPVSAWPEFADLDDDEEGDWVVGLAKHSWDGPYFAVSDDDIEDGQLPSMYEEIATVRGRERAMALAAHLNALNGGAP